MKKVFFIRSAPYDYMLAGLDLYDSFNAVIKKEYQPSLTPGARTYLDQNLPPEIRAIKQVYVSPDDRCIRTAKYFSSKPIIEPLLAEIRYVMEDFISKEEFYEHGKPNVTKARTAFVNALVSDQLQEEYQEIIRRTKRLMEYLKKISARESILISHGFYLKFIEAFVQESDLASDPERIKKYFDGTTESFSFGEGFSLFVSGDSISFDSYIKKHNK